MGPYRSSSGRLATSSPSRSVSTARRQQTLAAVLAEGVAQVLAGVVGGFEPGVELGQGVVGHAGLGSAWRGSLGCLAAIDQRLGCRQVGVEDALVLGREVRAGEQKRAVAVQRPRGVHQLDPRLAWAIKESSHLVCPDAAVPHTPIARTPRTAAPTLSYRHLLAQYLPPGCTARRREGLRSAPASSNRGWS